MTILGQLVARPLGGRTRRRLNRCCAQSSVVHVRRRDAVQRDDIMSATAVDRHSLVTTRYDAVRTVLRRSERRLHSIMPDEDVPCVVELSRHVEAAGCRARSRGLEGLRRPLQVGCE